MKPRSMHFYFLLPTAPSLYKRGVRADLNALCNTPSEDMVCNDTHVSQGSHTYIHITWCEMTRGLLTSELNWCNAVNVELQPVHCNSVTRQTQKSYYPVYQYYISCWRVECLFVLVFFYPLPS